MVSNASTACPRCQRASCPKFYDTSTWSKNLDVGDGSWGCQAPSSNKGAGLLSRILIIIFAMDKETRACAILYSISASVFVYLSISIFVYLFTHISPLYLYFSLSICLIVYLSSNSHTYNERAGKRERRGIFNTPLNTCTYLRSEVPAAAQLACCEIQPFATEETRALALAPRSPSWTEKSVVYS